MSDTRPAPATAAPRDGVAPAPPTGTGPPEPDLTSDHLPCGRSTDELLELVLDGRAAPLHDERDAHQRTCVHCRALAAEADRLWAPVRAAADAVVAPPDLLAAVMANVRRLGRDPMHLVIAGTRGATRISADVVRQIAERAATDVPHVALAMARRARSEPDAVPDAEVDPGDGSDTAGSSSSADAGAGELDQGRSAADGAGAGQGVGISGRHAVVDLAVITAYGASIPVVAAQVRGRVRDALEVMTTATDVRVDIYVDDIAPATT